MAAPVQTPEVVWAQRSSSSDDARNIVYVTINAPDIDPKTLKLDLQPTHVTFSGHSISKKIDYQVELAWFKEIDVAESKTHASPRGIDFILRKKDLGTEYWSRLTKESKKLHFLKTDFDKWVDEDEQDEKEEDPYAGYMGGEGMGGIDFSKLQGGGGMPDLGSLGSGMDMGEGDDSDDDDLPDLEDESGKKAGEEASSKKIEEVS